MDNEFNNATLNEIESPKSRMAAALLSFFLGTLGVHRFYVGKVGSGIAMLVMTILGWLTAALFIGLLPVIAVWIWDVIDFIMILCGCFKDGSNLPIKKW